METKCVKCGAPIKQVGNLWHELGALVFPQYCKSETPSAELHSPAEGK